MLTHLFTLVPVMTRSGSHVLASVVCMLLHDVIVVGEVTVDTALFEDMDDLGLDDIDDDDDDEENAE